MYMCMYCTCTVFFLSTFHCGAGRASQAVPGEMTDDILQKVSSTCVFVSPSCGAVCAILSYCPLPPLPLPSSSLSLSFSSSKKLLPCSRLSVRRYGKLYAMCTCIELLDNAGTPLCPPCWQRGKKVPEGLVPAEEIANFQQVASHPVSFLSEGSVNWFT